MRSARWFAADTQSRATQTFGKFEGSRGGALTALCCVISSVQTLSHTSQQTRVIVMHDFHSHFRNDSVVIVMLKLVEFFAELSSHVCGWFQASGLKYLSEFTAAMLWYFSCQFVFIIQRIIVTEVAFLQSQTETFIRHIIDFVKSDTNISRNIPAQIMYRYLQIRHHLTYLVKRST